MVNVCIAMLLESGCSEVFTFTYQECIHPGFWDLKAHGQVYALALGPYGLVLALTWQREEQGQPAFLVQVDWNRNDPQGRQGAPLT